MRKYALYRGGVRVKVVTGRGVDFVRATVSPQQTYGSEVAPTTHISTPLAIEQIPIKGVAEFQIPYYAPCLSSSFRANSETFYYSSGRNNLDIATSPPSINRYYAVGAGDDMDFSIFIGTPPCIHASQTAQFTKIKQGKVYDLRYDQYDPFREVQDGTAFLNARSIEDSDLL
uniref:Polyprotein n=2 Tax=Black queen cell virus TaxID=92395 RepID=G9I0S4_9VIRU|nr:polyprotein [Black queen cell virus]